MSDTIVVVGGLEGNVVSPGCWKVNQSNEVVHLCDIPDGSLGAHFSVCQTPQGFLITGGAGSRLCMMFIALKKSWVRLEKMLMIRQGHGSICIKEVLYVLGGFVGRYTLNSKPSNSVQSMVMKNGDWQYDSQMPLAVEVPTVSNIDNTVYVLDGESTKLLKMDVDIKIWNELASPPIARKCYGASMATARDQLIVAGGYQNVLALYNPKTDTWCTGQRPLKKHHYGTLVYHNNNLVFLGGYHDDGTDAVEEYDFEEGQVECVQLQDAKEALWSLCCSAEYAATRWPA